MRDAVIRPESNRVTLDCHRAFVCTPRISIVGYFAALNGSLEAPFSVGWTTWWFSHDRCRNTRGLSPITDISRTWINLISRLHTTDLVYHCVIALSSIAAYRTFHHIGERLLNIATLPMIILYKYRELIFFLSCWSRIS